MTQVFVDTGGFYAALNRKDQHHREATVLFTRAVEDIRQVMAFDPHFTQYGKFALVRA
jgi:predicted nucleic acid-binding protein